MKHLLLNSIDQIKNFFKSIKKLGIELEISSTKIKYDFIRRVLFKFNYFKLAKKDKNIILKYIKYFTHYFISHLKQCIKKCRKGTLYYSSIRGENFWLFCKKYN